MKGEILYSGKHNKILHGGKSDFRINISQLPTDLRESSSSPSVGKGIAVARARFHDRPSLLRTSPHSSVVPLSLLPLALQARRKKAKTNSQRLSDVMIDYE